MSSNPVRVRFAPSPTGYLHIGGARTALYSFLFAKAKGGSFILRVEDTDLERSEKKYEESQLADLNWLGVQPDEGPNNPGEYGPYRQSERLDLYKKYANQLIDKGLAFHCFCTEEELTAKKEKAEAQNLPPHYDGTCHHVNKEEALKRIAAGEKAVIRMKAFKKSYTIQDHVRGAVTFPEDMVGDFVIMRANGFPVYNFCCVIDDWQMKMSHVIRGDEHLNNTLRQLMIYEALDAKTPEFAHVSLLVGADKQKLSKRHGATSVNNYREQSFLPEAMVNYLVQLGWSHPEEKDVFDLEELKRTFSIDRFSKSPSMFDLEKLNFINGQHLRSLDNEKVLNMAKDFISTDSIFHKQEQAWQLDLVDLYKEKIEKVSELECFVSEVFKENCELGEDEKDVMGWETTPQIKSYLAEQLTKLKDSGAMSVSAEAFNEWMSFIKKELKIKGKPLFMGMRVALTGSCHGPDLKKLIPLTPIETLLKRMN